MLTLLTVAGLKGAKFESPLCIGFFDLDRVSEMFSFVLLCPVVIHGGEGHFDFLANWFTAKVVNVK